MIKFKIAMGFLWVLLTFALHVLPGPIQPRLAQAQGTRKDDIVFNSRGIPLAGATIRVCAMPATGQPCTPLALIYSDFGLTQALANPTTSDGLGNYFFYAAPGKYEIEISGPNITTKQIPNVVLPNDPSSPTFSGAVSAFSLSLGGNLTVSGNTTVVGNLASGTLNVTNQSSPPGTPATGTVNVYTKTADKRLYYKDDTGTEIGPLGPGSGAQLNVPNTFTAPQSIAADFHTKGPNPWFDITLFGGYESTAIQSTTGSISSSSTTLTLAAAKDFANGQGVVVIGAGPATALAAPTGLTVSQTNIGGSTAYSYCVVAEDYANGRSACSAVASTSSGPSSLGLFTAATISSCTRSSGVVSCTTTAAHNLATGAYIEIQAGTTGNSAYEGTATVTVTGSTTFTFTQYGAGNDSTGITAGTVRTVAQNLVQWNEVDYTVLRSYIYRCTTTCSLPANASNYSLAGVTQGMDGGFLDDGASLPASSVGDGDVSATAPTAATAQWLSTTISSGGGTTSLTLANSASTTVTNGTVLHDNVPAIKAACAAIGAIYPTNNDGGTLYIPNNGTFPIASTLNLGSACNVGVGAVELQLAAPLSLSASIIPGGSVTTIRGMPNFSNPTGFYQFEALSYVGGSAYPLFYLVPGTSHDKVLRNLLMKVGGAYQSAVVQDQDAGGNNVASIRYDNVTLSGGNCFGSPYIMGGGFGFFWTHGGQGLAATSFACSPATWVKANYGLGVSASQLPGIVYYDKTYVFGGMLWDAAGHNILSSIGIGHWELKEFLVESAYGPGIRAKLGQNTINDVSIVNPGYADFLGGAATPFFDLNGAGISGLKIFGAVCGNSNQPLFASNSSAQAVMLETGFYGSGCGYIGLQNYVMNHTTFNGATLNAQNGGIVQYAINSPATPSVSNTSGSLASGTYYYKIIANDANGNTSLASAVSAACTSNGSQACVVSWTLVPGQASTTLCRGPAPNSIACITIGPGFQTIGTSFTDNLAAFNFSGSQPSVTTGGSAILGSGGLATSTLKFVNGGNVAALSGSFSNPRAQTLPDVSGIVPVSSYLNSSYDNFNRANGAIGSSWTVTHGALNVSSNALVGTTGSGDNSAAWTSAAFSNYGQFAQLQVNTLNGTTDFVGPSVMNSAAAANFYDCIEDTTTLIIQKVSAGAGSNLTTASVTGSAGDVLRLEAVLNPTATAVTLTCYQNGVQQLQTTDSSSPYTSGAPGLLLFNNVATADNWSGGNLHPLAHLDAEQDWTKLQHFTQGVALGTESLTASPRGVQDAFLPGALTSTWTGSTWTLDKAITITRVQVQAKTAPSGCTTNAIVRLTDGTTPVNLTISSAANDSGPITQNYAAAASLTLSVQTAAAGCTTSPADANITVQYRMQ